MEKVDFLKLLQAARQAWEKFLAQITAEKMELADVPGAWTVKDIIAHVTWYDREMVDFLRSRTLAGSDWWNLPLDERNRLIYEQNHDRPLAEILAQNRQVYENLWHLAQQLDDKDLNDPARFKDMPLDWLPWEMIASNTFEHYLEHIKPAAGE